MAVGLYDLRKFEMAYEWPGPVGKYVKSDDKS